MQPSNNTCHQQHFKLALLHRTSLQTNKNTMMFIRELFSQKTINCDRVVNLSSMRWRYNRRMSDDDVRRVRQYKETKKNTRQIQQLIFRHWSEDTNDLLHSLTWMDRIKYVCGWKI